MIQTDAVDPYRAIVARVAGAALLLGLMILLPVNLMTALSYKIPDIVAHVFRFRFNIVVDVFYVLDSLLVLSLFYIILKPVNRGIALVASLFRLLYAVAWVVIALTMLNKLQLLVDSAQLSPFSNEQLQALASLQGAYGNNAYYIGLPAWALSSTLFSMLWLKSGYIPKTLALYCVVSSPWCAACSFAYLAVPLCEQVLNAWLYDVPMVLFELVLGLWLLIGGLRRPEGHA